MYRRVDAIQVKCFLGFLSEIHQLRGRGLELERHFIGLNAGFNFRVSNFGEPHFIQPPDAVERGTLCLGIPTRGIREIKNGIAATAEWNAGVSSGKKAAAPIAGAAACTVSAA